MGWQEVFKNCHEGSVNPSRWISLFGVSVSKSSDSLIHAVRILWSLHGSIDKDEKRSDYF